MVSIRQISKETNFSIATVSEALRNTGRVKEHTRAKILQAAEKLGYERNALIGDVMSKVRLSQISSLKGNIAVLESENFKKNRQSSDWHIKLFDGANFRANELGYKLDFFPFDSTNQSLKRLNDILYNRHIEGVFLPPYTGARDMDAIDWNRFSTVQLDYGLEKVRMHTVMPDHHTSIINTLNKLESLGYRRPGLCTENFQDKRIYMKWYAGFKAYENWSTVCEKIPVFEPDKLSKENFINWYTENKPDVILGHNSDLIMWLESAGFRVPEDVGFFSLNLHHSKLKTAGLNLRPDVLGAAAIDILVSQIRLQQKGVPKIAYTTAIEAEWVDGYSIKESKPGLKS